MVEVAIALGVVAFALLTVLALLPMGLKSNQISAEESRAVNILSLIESDLRSTYPLANGGKSQIYQFVLPYSLNSSGKLIFNSDLPAPGSALDANTTVGLDESESVASLAGRPRYQASVIYLNSPASGTKESLQARLIVNWPSQPGASLADLTDSSKVSGFVEALVSFPTP